MPLWFDIICLAIAMAFLDLAVTGKTYSYGRGGQRALLASVKSAPLRLGFLVSGIGVIAWVLRDFIHKSSALIS